MASATQLTTNDAAVLGALFDPEASLTVHTQISPVTTPGRYDLQTMHQIQQREHEALRNLNAETLSPSSIRAAIDSLGKLIEQYELYDSAYNNRAQARRTLYETEKPRGDTGSMALVFEDLAHAIQLASPSHPTAPVSPGQAKVLASAHTHRANLLYRASRSEDFRRVLDSVQGISSLDRDALEELANKYFAAGGRYGNNIAKQLAVQTNPYAKLCGSIVKEALRKEMESYLPRSETAVQ